MQAALALLSFIGVLFSAQVSAGFFSDTRPTPPKVTNEYSFTCKEVSTFDSTTPRINRCENKEVVCYAMGNGVVEGSAMNCQFKNKQ